MSLRRVSPTANLFRTSRLFSHPQAISRPPSSVVEVGTPPYPTQAAIQTTEAASVRGDWGLKRQLPRKTTQRQSQPLVFIENIDSVDYVTDFDSAAGHARTLEKAQELSLAVSRPAAGESARDPLAGVFESTYDSTDHSAIKSGSSRWKFRGPWIAGQNEREFEDYLQKVVVQMREDFRQYMQKIIAQARVAAQRRQLLEDGATAEALEALDTKDISLSDNEYLDAIRQMRKEPGALETHLENFLDLPRDSSLSKPGASDALIREGPPITHPSAGFSYLRSHSHTLNHRIHGPLDHPAPVEARVIHPHGTDSNTLRYDAAMLGVAGLVSRDTSSSINDRFDKADVKFLQADKRDGGKMFVVPRKISVDSQGQLRLVTQRADRDTLLAHGLEKPPRYDDAMTHGMKNRSLPSLFFGNFKSSRSTSAQGTGGSQNPSSRVTPFTNEKDLPETFRKAIEKRGPGNL